MERLRPAVYGRSESPTAPLTSKVTVTVPLCETGSYMPAAAGPQPENLILSQRARAPRAIIRTRLS